MTKLIEPLNDCIQVGGGSMKAARSLDPLERQRESWQRVHKPFLEAP